MMDKIFQVSEFNEYISLYLKQVGEVVVEGEISELKVYQDKFIYLTLKDTSSNLSVFAVCFNISGWRTLEVGMKVQAYGTPGIHQKSGKYSLHANKIIPAGEGALRLAFEKLKAQLESEGLFNTARKRTLPEFPQKIGLITAANSEAYNDFIKVISQRMGGLTIYFYPVSVQGRDSVASITKAFDYFNKSNLDLDCLVLCRGGGSLEDLISFNDEKVVRSVFGSKFPVVVGVGHERDISLCDLVCDLRASTPSNAAELLIAHRRERLTEVNYLSTRLISLMDGLIGGFQSSNELFAKSLINHQINLINQFSRHLNLLVNSLERSMIEPLNHLKGILSRFEAVPSNLQLRIRHSKDQLNKDRTRLLFSTHNWLKRQQLLLEQSTRLLLSFDHQTVLKRGYSLTTNSDGKLIKSVKQASADSVLLTQLSDGTITSVVTK